MKKIQILILICSLLLSCMAYAHNFVVKRIIIDGNRYLSPATVRHYVPININERLTEARTSQILQKLYHTGLFENVSLARDGNTLIVKVEERPMIASVIFEGNSIIKSDKIKEVLKEAKLERGQIFNQAVLEQVKLGLEQAYQAQGHFEATVNPIVNKEKNHRVTVDIEINEGGVRKVSAFDINGNTIFSDSKLISQFDLTTTKLWSWLTGGDQYSDSKLEQDLENLHNFYLDHGYLKMQVVSHHVSPSKDGKHVIIHIQISEGPQYYLTSFDVLGDLLGFHEQLIKLVKVKIDHPVSRADILATDKMIANFYGNKGYAFTDVSAKPLINESKHLVKLLFIVNPRKRVYVHRINFAGNVKTADYVLRRSMLQMEGGLVHTSYINESMRRLRNLPYLKDAQVSTVPVAGKSNQVDLNVNVKEQPSAQAIFRAGYGTNGVVLGFSVNQQNVLGTGNQLGLNIQRDNLNRSYSIDYTNPYFTDNGVSQSVSLYANQTTPNQINLADYTFDTYGTRVDYGIPVSMHNGITVGAGIEAIKLNAGSGSSNLIRNFIVNNGRRFDHGLLDLGWTFNNLDRFPFSTKGLHANLAGQLSTPFGKHRLSYYKFSFRGSYYQPLGKYFIGKVKTVLGYGGAYGALQGGLPFFENFYAGGISFNDGSVRGYETNSLGPRDDRDNRIGGNSLVSGSVALIFPNPISDQLRTSIFMDAGNVYNTRTTGVNLGELRYSVGIDGKWHVPFVGAIIEFSLAKAIHPRSGDETQFFQFSFGTSF